MKTKVQRLTEQLEKAKKEEVTKRSLLKFNCVCGKKHRIKDCEAIQTHWYNFGRDEWYAGEIMICCPETDVKNRILFEMNDDSTFKRIYLPLFIRIKKEYGNDHGNHINNFFFDRNKKKFGLTS